VSDVPFRAFLSGGVDSTRCGMAGAMKSLYARFTASKKILQREYAAQVAAVSAAQEPRTADVVRHLGR
jgi:hypothetical protein